MGGVRIQNETINKEIVEETLFIYLFIYLFIKPPIEKGQSLTYASTLTRVQSCKFKVLPVDRLDIWMTYWLLIMITLKKWLIQFIQKNYK